MEQSKIFENYFSKIKSDNIQKQVAINDHYFQNVKDLSFNENQYNKIQARVVINDVTFECNIPPFYKVVGMVIHYKREEPNIVIYNGLISSPYNYDTAIIVNKIANPSVENISTYNSLCNMSDDETEKLKNKLKHLQETYIGNIKEVLINILGTSFNSKSIKTKYVTNAINKLLFDSTSIYYNLTYNMLPVYSAISNSILEDNNFINTYEKIKYLYDFIDRKCV